MIRPVIDLTDFGITDDLERVLFPRGFISCLFKKFFLEFFERRGISHISQVDESSLLALYEYCYGDSRNWSKDIEKNFHLALEYLDFYRKKFGAGESSDVAKSFKSSLQASQRPAVQEGEVNKEQINEVNKVEYEERVAKPEVKQISSQRPIPESASIKQQDQEEELLNEQLQADREFESTVTEDGSTKQSQSKQEIDERINRYLQKLEINYIRKKKK